MTKEELKEHCERQVQHFERVEKIMPVTPNDWKRYKEHKLILELLEQEPCEDVVSIQGVAEVLLRYAHNEEGKAFAEFLISQINDLPSVTPQPKKGHWIKDYDNSALDGLYHCSVCGRKLWIPKEESVSDYPYCHCGAEMESD